MFYVMKKLFTIELPSLELSHISPQKETKELVWND